MESTELKISLTGFFNIMFDGQDNSFPDALDAILVELIDFVTDEKLYAIDVGDDEVTASYEKIMKHLTIAKKAIL